jgi:peptide alpha-N-acetyltransferase
MSNTAPSQDEDIEYVDYTDETMLAEISRLVSKDLSEPYSVFTYRYFLHNWPRLCLCVYQRNVETKERGPMIATLVCKAEGEVGFMQGYIAMLAVDQTFRNRGIGSNLVIKGIERMIEAGCTEIMLETEVRTSSINTSSFFNHLITHRLRILVLWASTQN